MRPKFGVAKIRLGNRPQYLRKSSRGWSPVSAVRTTTLNGASAPESQWSAVNRRCAMGLYEVVVFVHVAAAMALLSGSVVASPAVRAAVRRAQTTQEIRAYLAIGRPLLVLEPAAAIAVLATGV